MKADKARRESILVCTSARDVGANMCTVESVNSERRSEDLTAEIGVGCSGGLPSSTIERSPGDRPDGSSGSEAVMTD
eukprot:1499103-Amphidinium_carterae.2